MYVWTRLKIDEKKVNCNENPPHCNENTPQWIWWLSITSLILICVAICWIRCIVSTCPFHKFSLPNGLPQHFCSSWLTIFCNCIANPLSMLIFCWLSLTEKRHKATNHQLHTKLNAFKEEKGYSNYHVQQPLRAFVVAFVELSLVNWRYLYLIPTIAIKSTHIETFVDREPMNENLIALLPRQDHWNQLFHVYTVLLYGNGAEFQFHYHHRLAHLMNSTC